MAAMFSLTFANAQKFRTKSSDSCKISFAKKVIPMQKKLNGKRKDNYEAEFEVNETDYSILIDVSGNIIETEIEIKIDELPANAKHTFLKTMQDKKSKKPQKLPTAKALLPTKQKSKAKT